MSFVYSVFFIIFVIYLLVEMVVLKILNQIFNHCLLPPLPPKKPQQNEKHSLFKGEAGEFVWSHFLNYQIYLLVTHLFPTKSLCRAGGVFLSLIDNLVNKVSLEHINAISSSTLGFFSKIFTLSSLIVGCITTII